LLTRRLNPFSGEKVNADSHEWPVSNDLQDSNVEFEERIDSEPRWAGGAFRKRFLEKIVACGLGQKRNGTIVENSPWKSCKERDERFTNQSSNVAQIVSEH
jgi:hypothetical protein